MTEWVPLVRDFEVEATTLAVPLSDATSDPLSVGASGLSKGADKAEPEPQAVDAPASASPEPEEVDPLGAGDDDPLGAGFDPLGAGDDPLSGGLGGGGGGAAPVKFGLDVSFDDKKVEEDDGHGYEEGFVTWAERRDSILKEYQTDKTITIANLKNIDNSEDASEQEASAAPPQSRERSRLEELESTEEASQKSILLLTCAEYIAHVKELNRSLSEAWNHGERVKAVKLAIQCSKLLADTTVLQFYPSMFVLVTDLLDNFGALVFERIRERGAGFDPKTGTQRGPLGNKFSHKDVSDIAKETCRNWFYKIASVKELLPRFYVEVAIMRCYMFIESEKKQVKIIQKLADITRGLGDPLVSLYARAYLVRRGRHMMRPEKSYLLTSFEDTVFILHRQLTTEHFKEGITRKGCSMIEYWNLYAPALDWLSHCIGYNASSAEFAQIWQAYCNGGPLALAPPDEEVKLDADGKPEEALRFSIILNYLMRNFDSSNFMGQALKTTRTLRATDLASFPKHKLYVTWAMCCIASPPAEKERLKILNEAWKFLTKLDNLHAYLEAATAYIEYVLKYFGDKEANVMLKDVIVHVKAKQEGMDDSVYDDKVMPRLKAIVNLLLTYYKDFTRLVFLDKFLPLLDLLRKQVKYEVFKNILTGFSKMRETTSDPVVIHTMLDITRQLHDVLDGMSIEDERKQVSLLITKFVDRVDFGKDLEKALNFYVDLRQGCTNLDTVVNHIVHKMAALGMRAYSLVHGKHNKRTTAFAKACLAACYVTIPTSEHYPTRLRLLLLCAQVSLVNGLITQAEAFCKLIITTIKEMPQVLEVSALPLKLETEIAQFLDELVNVLLVQPGHPEHGPLYLVTALVSVMNKFPWNAGQGHKVRATMRVMRMVCMMSQPKLPWHIKGIESNDTLFPSDKPKMADMLASLLKHVMDDLNAMKEAGKGDAAEAALQCRLSFELHELLATHAVLTKPMATLVFKLFQLAFVGGVVHEEQAKQAVGSLRHLADKLESSEQDGVSVKIYRNVAAKMSEIAGIGAGLGGDED